MIYAFLWPNFTSASAYCYLDWFEIPLQFHELHKPNPVPNCALRHLSNQALCTHKSVTPFLFHHQTHHFRWWFPSPSFPLWDLNLHLMGIRSTRPHRSSPAERKSNRVAPTAVDLDPCDSCDMAMDIARLHSIQLGDDVDPIWPPQLSCAKLAEGTEGSTAPHLQKECKTSNFAERLLEVLKSLYVYVIGYNMNMYIFT